jgi:Aerotolerance regulator N-terminal
MVFLSQHFLWGVLGILIPLLIHLLNNKNKNLKPWAATAFLEERPPIANRSFIPQDILLLLLRMLIFGLLSILLAGPILDFFKSKSPKSISVFEENESIKSNFKFELEKAFSKNEKPIFFTKNLNENIEKDKNWKEESQKRQTEIQQIINEAALKWAAFDSIHIYLSPAQDFYRNPCLLLMKNMHLNWGLPAQKTKIPVWKAGNAYFDNVGRIQNFDSKTQQIVFEDSINIAFETNNSKERTFAAYAFAAIKNATAFPIKTVETNNQKPDVIFKNFTAGLQKVDPKTTSIFVPIDLYQSSIRQGTLPDDFLQKIVSHVGFLKLNQTPSLLELEKSVVVSTNKILNPTKSNLNFFWLILLLCIGFERFISLKSGK